MYKSTSVSFVVTDYGLLSRQLILLYCFFIEIFIVQYMFWSDHSPLPSALSYHFCPTEPTVCCLCVHGHRAICSVHAGRFWPA